VYEHGKIRPGDAGEAEGLEPTAAWDEHHLLPRLVESLSD